LSLESAKNLGSAQQFMKYKTKMKPLRNVDQKLKDCFAPACQMNKKPTLGDDEAS